jgi:hypothetical protein
MSAGRILLAGILGGIAMFVWTSIAHIATPLGMTGIKEIPNEQAVLSAMQSSMGNTRGLYFFPGMGTGPNATPSERRAAMSNYQQVLDKNPSGILIYHPAGAKAMTTGQLLHEFVFEVFEALLLAILLSMAALRTFGSRLGFAVIVGIIAAVSTNLSYWNWYGFPASYTHAAMFVEAMKYIVAGGIVALLMGKVSAKAAGA